MASVCGTRGKTSIGSFVTFNIMSVGDFVGDSKPRRRVIDSDRFFDVERQSWLAGRRQNFATISCFIGHATWKFS